MDSDDITSVKMGRDDVIGELVIDVTSYDIPDFNGDSSSTLLLSDQPLYHKGQRSGLAAVSFTLSWEDGMKITHEGQADFEGRVLRIHLQEAHSLRSADTILGVGTKNDVYAQAYVMDGAMVSQCVGGDGHPTTKLQKIAQNFILKQGYWKMPFKIKIPKDCPSTFHVEKIDMHGWGHNEYSMHFEGGQIDNTLHASIDIDWGVDRTYRMPINVWQYIPTAVPHFLREQRYNFGKDLGCFCCSKGHIAADMKLDRCAYACGEIAYLNLRVDTKQLDPSTACKVTVQLIQSICYRGPEDHQREYDQKSLFKIQAPLIRGGVDYDEMIQLHIPATSASHHGHGTPLLQPPMNGLFAGGDSRDREFSFLRSASDETSAFRPSWWYDSDPVKWFYYIYVHIDLPWAVDCRQYFPIVIGTEGLVKILPDGSSAYTLSETSKSQVVQGVFSAPAANQPHPYDGFVQEYPDGFQPYDVFFIFSVKLSSALVASSSISILGL